MNIIKRILPAPVKRMAKNLISQQVKQSLPPIPTEAEIKSLVVSEVRKSLAPKPKPAPEYGKNVVINHPVLENSKIVFIGTGNTLYCEEGVTLKNSLIHFSGNDSLIYLSGGGDSRYSSVHMVTHNNSTIFVGTDTNFNSFVDFKAHLAASEHKNLIIGNNCMFSFNMWITTSDAHAAFDAKTRQRFNLPGSVLIGDHVWVGQNVTILKETRVGSGSIIGANSLLTGKKMQSNAVYAGAPARLVRVGAFYNRPDVRLVDKIVSKSNETDAKKAIFSSDGGSPLTLDQVDEGMAGAKTSEAKLNYVRKYIVANKSKNRFYINPEA